MYTFGSSVIGAMALSGLLGIVSWMTLLFTIEGELAEKYFASHTFGYALGEVFTIAPILLCVGLLSRLYCASDPEKVPVPITTQCGALAMVLFVGFHNEGRVILAKPGTYALELIVANYLPLIIALLILIISFVVRTVSHRS